MLNRRAPHHLSSLLFLFAASSCEPPSDGEVAQESSLSGSHFEIDTNANLIVDNDATVPVPQVDWASIPHALPTDPEVRKHDAPTGGNDDSYAGGSKEDDACPGTTTGGIPNNKSDLLTFGIYEESGVGGSGFLHMFWSRVADPSGSTHMDFEFNQSTTVCTGGGNPVNRVRTAGDLLIEYSVDSGGASATLSRRVWSGSAWGPSIPSGANAIGSINTTSIAAASSDGLIASGSIGVRTFGEASIDLDVIFGTGQCQSFGSVMVKSRSSPSFSSQLKDFIAPLPISLTNCASVIIRKQTNPNGATDQFKYTHNLAGPDVASPKEFMLSDDGVQSFSNVLLNAGGTPYEITEDLLQTPFELTSIDCSASTNIAANELTTSVADKKVTFTLDDDGDVLDCTFNNRRRGTIVVEKVTTDGMGGFTFTSTTLTPNPFTLTTTGLGQPGKASQTFGDLSPGTYDVAETVPAGWNQVSATCSDGSPIGAIALSAGETVTCTFTNAVERGAIRIVKTRKHAAEALLTQPRPHAGVVFDVTGPAPAFQMTTGADGTVCLGGLPLGTYTVTEQVPLGYVADDPPVIDLNNGNGFRKVTVTESTCAQGAATANFANTPLTTITILIDSIVDGGTATTINCGGTDTAQTNALGDGSLVMSNRRPQIFNCEINVVP